MLPEFIDRLAGDLDMDAVARVGLAGLRLGSIGIPTNLREGDGILARRGLGLKYMGRRRLSGGYCGEMLSCNWVDASQVICARVTEAGRPLYLFATHWCASPYSEYLDQVYRSTDLEPPSDRQRRYAYAEIERGLVKRQREARDTLTFIDKMAGAYACVLMGDLNSDDTKPEIGYLKNTGGFYDSRTAAIGDMVDRKSWDPERNLNQRKYYQGNYIATNPTSKKYLYFKLFQDFNRLPRHIDFILTRGPIQTKAYRVVLDETEDGVHASDHFGVLAEIDVQAPVDGEPLI